MEQKHSLWSARVNMIIHEIVIHIHLVDVDVTFGTIIKAAIQTK